MKQNNCEIESNETVEKCFKFSWDSMGCESGIVLRESAERDDCSYNTDFLENSLDDFSTSPKHFKDDPLDEDIASTPVHGKDGFPTNFSAVMLDENLPQKKFTSTGLQQNAIQNNNGISSSFRGPIDFSGLRDHNSEFVEIEKSKKVDCKSETEDEKGGAFKPVIKYRNRRNSMTSSEKPLSINVNAVSSQTLSIITQQSSRTNTPSPNNLIGEKRRWTGATHASTDEMSNTLSAPISPIASRTRGSLMMATTTNLMNNTNIQAQKQQEVPRAVLTARRTRVRVIYHDPQQLLNRNQRHSLQVLNSLKQSDGFGAGGESPPSASCLANKRGRLAAQSILKAASGERPSLNFDKMRERMMGFTIPSAFNN